METRKRTPILALSAVAALICIGSFFGVQRLLDRQEEAMFRYKMARNTTATAMRKEHRVNAQPAYQWIVYYRISGFPIYRFHKSATGQWEQAGIDSNATSALATAEQRRNQQSGDREAFVSQSEYESFSVGDRVSVTYRLESDDKSVEIISVERVNP